MYCILSEDVRCYDVLKTVDRDRHMQYELILEADFLRMDGNTERCFLESFASSQVYTATRTNQQPQNKEMQSTNALALFRQLT